MIFHPGISARELVVEFAVMKEDVGPDQICDHLRKISLKQQPLIDIGDVGRICHPTQTWVGWTVSLLQVKACLAIGGVKPVIGFMFTALLYPLVQLRKQIVEDRIRNEAPQHQITLFLEFRYLHFAQHRTHLTPESLR